MLPMLSSQNKQELNVQVSIPTSPQAPGQYPSGLTDFPCALRNYKLQRFSINNNILRIITSPYYEIFSYNERINMSTKEYTIKPVKPCHTPNCHGSMLFDYIDQDYICLLCAQHEIKAVLATDDPVYIEPIKRYFHEVGHHNKAGRPKNAKDGVAVKRPAPHNKKKVA